MFLRTFQGGGQLYAPSKTKGLRDFGHSMSTSAIATILYLIHNNTLLQNVTEFIAKCNSYFITKSCITKVLQNMSGFSLQNATIITKCDVYHKMRRYTY